MSKKKLPTILVYDIETSPMVTYTWGLFDQNIGLGQIKEDWYVLSWSAKYYVNEAGDVFGPHKDVMYMDNRAAKDVSNDKKLLEGIWKLLDECDIALTQNGVKFDNKKLNARFVQQGIQGGKPPSPYRNIDTLKIARKHFAFTSNKLEYMTDKLCTKYKKLKPKKFAGFEMWKQCMSGNKEAWKEMEKYNTYDVLSLEELYQKLSAWDNSINFSVYNNGEHICTCGSTDLIKKGLSVSNAGIFQRYKCKSCGKPVQDKENLLPLEARKALKKGSAR